ncbi:unnamed protein product, partial [Schistosoma curassoni]|uniref:Conjugal transfer protein TraG n=1 Tax=Schistosoma curassoni TaxID=6186 RepID=A0A183JPU0_9TREM
GAGLQQASSKEGISIETQDKIQERKNKKTAINSSQKGTERVRAQAEYTETNKQVKIIGANKQKYVEELAATAEKAAEGNVRQLYDTTKKLERKYGKPE